MITLLEKKSENSSILVHFNKNIGLIEKIQVFHKSQTVVNILSLGYVMHKKCTLNAAVPSGNDIVLAHEYASLKEKAYSLFLKENLTLEKLNSFGYQKK